jgi:hypothetical protein
MALSFGPHQEPIGTPEEVAQYLAQQRDSWKEQVQAFMDAVDCGEVLNPGEAEGWFRAMRVEQAEQMEEENHVE